MYCFDPLGQIKHCIYADILANYNRALVCNTMIPGTLLLFWRLLGVLGASDKKRNPFRITGCFFQSFDHHLKMMWWNFHWKSFGSYFWSCSFALGDDRTNLNWGFLHGGLSLGGMHGRRCLLVLGHHDTEDWNRWQTLSGKGPICVHPNSVWKEDTYGVEVFQKKN